MQFQPLVDALRDVVLGQQVIHADETPVQMLAPGSKKTHRLYVWAYATSQFCETAAVVYDFSPGGAGEHARNFLQDWRGKLVGDDFGGYKASFELGVTEIGCLARARRKFFELHATNKSMLAEQRSNHVSESARTMTVQRAMNRFNLHREYPAACLHAVKLSAYVSGTLLRSLSTIADVKLSNPPWVNFNRQGGSVFNQRQQSGDMQGAHGYYNDNYFAPFFTNLSGAERDVYYAKFNATNEWINSLELMYNVE